MIINEDKNFIFIHIPKTAGGSMSKVLRATPGSVKVKPTHGFAKDKCLKDMFSFAFVRNPWDRIYSIYSFVSQNKRNGMRRGDQQKYKEMGFKRFLLEGNLTMLAMQNGVTVPPVQKCQQLMWVTNKKGDIIVDYIGRFETLYEDFVYITNEIDVGKLPHLNKSNHGDYRNEYDNEMIDFIAKYRKDDINTFNYEFE